VVDETPAAGLRRRDLHHGGPFPDARRQGAVIRPQRLTALERVRLLLGAMDRIVRRVMARLRPGSILILHDGSPLGPADRGQTVAALETILTEAEHRGWRATTVADLLASARPDISRPDKWAHPTKYLGR